MQAVVEVVLLETLMILTLIQILQNLEAQEDQVVEAQVLVEELLMLLLELQILVVEAVVELQVMLLTLNH
tara:strand:+ start:294 stop:503 length:210 start_codon:yes stop_codon:yes gene_type:complete